MNTFNALLLTDKSRLQEIYDLRVEAYENSYKAHYINRNVFPNGWRDHLDEQALHWIIEKNGLIIASARLVILENLSDTGEEYREFVLPSDRPFAYFSRLAIHKDFRGKGITRILDEARLNYINQNNIAFGIAYSFGDRRDALLKQGFKELGVVDYNWGGAPLPALKQHLFIFLKNRSLIHNHISFWGRTLSEYEQMFNMKIKAGQNILSIADGPSTFNKEAHEKGASVYSIDPVYGLTIEKIKQYFIESYQYNKDLFLNSKSVFVFKSEEEINNLLTKRSNTFEIFLEDFKAHPTRYNVGKLPEIRGVSPNYELCLCSNFLFLFGHKFNLAFHIASIIEMLRLAKEVRIFPIYDINGNRSPYLDEVLNYFSKTYEATIENVDYEVYKGGNKMLLIKHSN